MTDQRHVMCTTDVPVFAAMKVVVDSALCDCQCLFWNSALARTSSRLCWYVGYTYSSCTLHWVLLARVFCCCSCVLDNHDFTDKISQEVVLCLIGMYGTIYYIIEVKLVLMKVFILFRSTRWSTPISLSLPTTETEMAMVLNSISTCIGLTTLQGPKYRWVRT